MTVLTLRRIRQDRFEVTGPDIEPMTFRLGSRPGTGASGIIGGHRSGKLAETVRRPGERKTNSTDSC